MKQKLFYCLALMCLGFTCSAQKIKRTPLLIDSTARKHELHLNASMVVAGIFSNGGSVATAIDLIYARVYNGTHYLRAGAGVVNVNQSWQDGTGLAEYGLPDTADYDIKAFNKYTQVYGRLGYEISLGKRKTRFLFGADLILGYFSNNQGTQAYLTSFTDSVPKPVYFRNADYRGLSVGINPRGTVRYNFSKLFSAGITLGFTAGSLITFSENKWGSDFVYSGYKPVAFSDFDFRFNPELNLIFKIP